MSERKAVEPQGSKSFSSLYRCAVPTQCLSIAGSKDSPVCAILASRDHLVVKLWKIGREKYMDRQEQYEAYCTDRSVKEIMEDELDSICDRLMMPGSEAADGRDPGRAESLCWAIALIENPYAPNMDAVKGKMMLRYERRVREAEETVAMCNANVGGDPASGCESEPTGDDGLCDQHRESLAVLESSAVEEDDETLVEA